MVQRIDGKQGKFVLDAATQVGSVILKVKDLERQIAFYENVVGLVVLEKVHNMLNLVVKAVTTLFLN